MILGIAIAVHVIACVGLIFFILIQQGKGGGLIESFSSAESIFGTKTNTFLTRTTTVLAITFFITCLLLAFLSVQQTKSVIGQNIKKQPKAEDLNKIIQEAVQQKQAEEKTKEEATQQETKQQETKEITNKVEENNAAKDSAATQ